MRIVIIEDEHIAAQDILNIINSIRPEYQVVKILNSVVESISYLSKEKNIDLIFSDIQLEDGLSFEIFEQVNINCPVIFCTAYNNFALEAFRNNGIDYLLKPFDNSHIEKSIQKFEKLINYKIPKYSELIDLFTNKPKERNRVLLAYQKDKIIPLNVDDIAIFFLKNNAIYFQTFENTIYSMNGYLDELEQQYSDSFFRANRQMLINRKAIKDLSPNISRKIVVHLNIKFSPEVTVSKEKSKEFMTWLVS